MSSALALGAVSAVLKDLLDNGVIGPAVSTVGGSVSVSVGPPDRITTGAGEENKLNLFLYQVTPNQGWRNVGLPSRNGSGERLANPPLALDLHYLLSAYGEDELHAEVLLGYGMQVLHETPVLSRADIGASLSSTPSLSGEDLPPVLQALSGTALADQVEQIKVSPQPLSTEDISKLWSAFGAKFRPSAAYQVSVVLIEASRPTLAPLPVRGRAGLVLPATRPVIVRVLSRAATGERATAEMPITVGSTLVLRGRNLRGDATEVRIGDTVATPAEVGESEVSALLGAGLRAGAQVARVVHRVRFGDSPELRIGAESNAATFLLRPRVESVTPDPDDGPHTEKLLISVTPEVGSEQRVTLLLNELDPPSERPAHAYGLDAPPRNQPDAPASSPTVEVPVGGVVPGSYLVRLRVDDAESPLEADADGRYASPRVDIR